MILIPIATFKLKITANVAVMNDLGACFNGIETAIKPNEKGDVVGH